MEILSEFIQENGGKKMKNLWENEEKESVEKMLKKLVSTAKKSVKPKKVKDPEAPKKKSAWLLFCEEERMKIKEEIKDGKIEKIAPKEMFAELAKRWTELKENKDEKEKVDKLKEAAKVSAEEYKEKIKTYVPKEGVKVEKKKRAKKDKNAPKGARSAWVFFCEAERKKIAKEKKKLDGKEVMAELSARWKNVKGTKKAKKFEEMAKEDKVRYAEEMENYSPPEEEKEESEDEESDNESEKTEEKDESEDEEDKVEEKEEEVSEEEVVEEEVVEKKKEKKAKKGRKIKFAEDSDDE